MYPMNKKRLFTWLISLFAYGIVTSAWARPSMWWDHFESTAQNQTECVNQAKTVLTAEKAGQVSSDADSVRIWSEKSVAVAECIKFGDKLIVSVLASSNDAGAGSKLYNTLKAGMVKK